MALKLHLGVIDIPYAYDQGKGKGKRRVQKSITTGEVAEILEDKYHVMEIFYEANQEQIAGFLESSLQGALESAMMGAGNMNSLDPTGAGMSDIEDRFKEFLSLKEIEGIGAPGVPTEAAKRGVNHRMTRPYQRRAARPSFIDTGLYQTSFKAWTD